MSSESGFSAWDWVVFTLSLAASLGLGVYASLTGRQKQSANAQTVANNYLMGGRNMNPVAVALSTMVGAMSSVMVVGNPAEMYAYGTQLWMNIIGVVLAFFFIHGVILKVLYPLKITSVYTYIERRFKSPTLRSVTVCTTFIGTFFYMGLVAYSPSLALNTITGLPVWVSIVAMGAVCTIYASWGGVRAVVYTDILQACVMFGGVVLILSAATEDVGSIAEVWEINNDHDRVEFFNLDPDPLQRHSLWLVIIQGYFATLLVFGMGQPQVQRICSVATWKQAIGAHYLNMMLLVALYCVVNYSGVAVYAVYAGCDPMATGDIDKPDQIVPYYVMDRLSRWPGVPGIFVASLYAGGLSSYSSQINAVSAVMWEDFFKGARWVQRMEEGRRPLVNVTVSIVTGVAGIIAGLVASNMGGLFQVGQTILGTIHAPLLGLFILGMTCPFANKIGGSVGFTSSLAFNVWITAGAMLKATAAPMLPFDDSGCNTTFVSTATSLLTTEGTTTTISGGTDDSVFPLYALSYTLYALFGVSITCFVGAVVSLLTGPWRCQTTGLQLVLPSCGRLQQRWERRQGFDMGGPTTDSKADLVSLGSDGTSTDRF